MENWLLGNYKYLHDNQLEQILTLADLTKEPVTKYILTMMKWYSDVQIIYQQLSNLHTTQRASHEWCTKTVHIMDKQLAFLQCKNGRVISGDPLWYCLLKITCAKNSRRRSFSFLTQVHLRGHSHQGLLAWRHILSNMLPVLHFQLRWPLFRT